MDKLNHYRELVKNNLLEWESYMRRGRMEGIEIQHVFDEANDHYLLILLGWNKERRVSQVYLHLRIQNGKIWVETDETDVAVALELLKAGVPNQDIVLGFQPPQLRHLTDFAAA